MATHSAGIPKPPYQVSAKQAHVATDLARAHQEPGVIRPNNLPQSYPYAPFPHDNRDEDARIKGALIDWDGSGGGRGVTPQYIFTEADLQYIKDKQAYIENAEFELWAYNQWDHTDPANARIFREIFPEFVDRQRAYIEYCSELQKRWALIVNTGVNTREDAMFKYLLQTGQIHVPKDLTAAGMLQNHPAAVGGVDQPLADNERGIFNPLRILGVDRPLPQGGFDPRNRAYAFPDANRSILGLGLLNPAPDGTPAGTLSNYRNRLANMLYGNNVPNTGTAVTWPLPFNSPGVGSIPSFLQPGQRLNVGQ